MAGSWQVINGRRIYSGDDTNETVTGTAEPETLGGRHGDDVLQGDGGDDQVNGGHGSDILHGNAGNDRLWDWDGTAPPGNTVIGRDQLFGGDGDDHLNVWSPDTGDVADGGAGIDTLEVRFNYPNNTPMPGDPPITFALLPGGSSVIRLNNINTVAVNNIERILFFGNSGVDFVTGGALDDTIVGNGGNDVLRGGGGNDRLESGTGQVNIDGGAGIDRASFDLAGATTGITLRNAAAINLGTFGTIRNVEILSNFSLGSGHDRVTLTQEESASFSTGAGNDTVSATFQVSVEAGAGADLVTLGAGNDYVDPGTGADVVRLGGGNDQLDNVATGSRADTAGKNVSGEAGDDRLYTANGQDTLDGGTGNDQLLAGVGDDRAAGGDGNDTMHGEGGADQLRAGAGNDNITTDYDFWTATTPQNNDAAYGEDGNDSITGGIGADTIDGGAGDDTIAPLFRLGGSGFSLDGMADRITGGLGDDRLSVSSLVSSGESQALRVQIGPITRVYIDGALIGTALGFESLEARVFGNGGHTVIGGALADVVTTGNGNDSISLGDGADWADLASYRGADTLLAGTGNDTATITLDRADRVLMGDGDDALTAYGIYGSDPTPVTGGRLDGGNGFDTLTLHGGGRGLSFDGLRISIEGVVVALATGFERVVFTGTTLDERMTGTTADDLFALGGGADSASGGGGADSLDGAAGNDRLDGGDGNDTLAGGAGANTLLGGAGADLLTLGADTLADVVNGGAGLDGFVLAGGLAGPITMTGAFPATVTILSNGVAVATLVGIDAVTLAGSAGADSLFGTNGTDSLDGTAGADTLSGGAGDDVLASFSGQGPDRLEGGNGFDLARINRASASGGLAISLATPAVEQTLADGTVLLGIERLDFTGGTGADSALGGALADTLAGGAGGDSLAGGGGDDRLDPGFGAGADPLDGGAGADTVMSFNSGAHRLSGGAGAEDLLQLSRFAETLAGTLDLAAAGSQTLTDGTVLSGFERGLVNAGSGADSLSGGGLDDTLAGNAGEDRLAGQAGQDSLVGGNGADTLLGGAGADSLAGGTGNDLLAGGADADRFLFDNLAGGIDLVEDFAAADLLRISRLGFGGGLVAGAPAVLVSGATPVPAPGSSGVFLYDTDNGELAFDADGAGAGVAVVFAELRAGGMVATLTAAQILIE